MLKILDKNLFLIDIFILFSIFIFGFIYFYPIFLFLVLIFRVLIRFNNSLYISFFTLVILLKFMFFMGLEASENYLKNYFLNIYLILFFFQITDHINFNQTNINIDNIKLKTKKIFLLIFSSKVSILWFSFIAFEINIFEVKNLGQLYKYFLSFSFIYLLFIKEKINTIETLFLSIFLLMLIFFIFNYSYSRYEIMCFIFLLILINNIDTSLKIFLASITILICLLALQYIKIDFLNFYNQLSNSLQYPYSNFNIILTYLDSIYTKMNYFHYFETFIYGSNDVPMYENYVHTKSIDKFGSVFDIGIITEFYVITGEYFYIYIFITLLFIYLIQIFCQKYILFHRYISFFIFFNLYNYFDSIMHKQSSLSFLLFSIFILFMLSNKLKKSI